MIRSDEIRELVEYARRIRPYYASRGQCNTQNHTTFSSAHRRRTVPLKFRHLKISTQGF